MSVYQPDTWNVVRIAGPTGDDSTIDKVFGCWVGGVLDGDSWRMNSGIVQVREYPEVYDFVGTTGSVYICRKDGEGVRGYGAMVLQAMQREAEKRDHTITIIPATEAVAT